METPKILVTGSEGQLGKALQLQYPDAKFTNSSTLDITRDADIEWENWTGIDVIINAAAYTNVDGAQSEAGRVKAWQVNAEAVGKLARVATEHDITLIHISSDYVFDGTKKLHSEVEHLSPISAYGASKAAGDLLAATTDKHYILRTSWVVGDGHNFVKTMLMLAQKDIAPSVISDQIGRLTFTNELARAIDHLLVGECDFGTYNVTNSGDHVSWAGIAREVFKLAGRDDLAITDTTTAEFYKGKEGIAPRPAFSPLYLAKLQATGFVGTDWMVELKNYVKNHQAEQEQAV